MNTETEVFFYHLENRSLEQVLPTLLERSIERGWRAVDVLLLLLCPGRSPRLRFSRDRVPGYVRAGR